MRTCFTSCGVYRRPILPGTLVLAIESSVPFGSTKIKSGLVLAVRYPREGPHVGCEERFSVLWMGALRIKDECDCGLMLPSELTI